MDRPAPGRRRRSERIATMGRRECMAHLRPLRAARCLRRARVACAIVGLALLMLCIGAASASAGVSFTRAWGWGVSDGQNQFETCTNACQTGLAGGGVGQFDNPLG